VAKNLCKIVLTTELIFSGFKSKYFLKTLNFLFIYKSPTLRLYMNLNNFTLSVAKYLSWNALSVLYTTRKEKAPVRSRPTPPNMLLK